MLAVRARLGANVAAHPTVLSGAISTVATPPGKRLSSNALVVGSLGSSAEALAWAYRTVYSLFLELLQRFGGADAIYPIPPWFSQSLWSAPPSKSSHVPSPQLQ
jgi:hypothetical protein